MTGSIEAQIIIPIVAFVLLFSWLGIVYWADSHPYWKGHKPPAQSSGQGVGQGIREPLIPPGRDAPNVPGQRVPAGDDSPRVATTATAAQDATAAPADRSRRDALLLRENRLQLS